MLYIRLYFWNKDKNWKIKLKEKLIDYMEGRDLHFIVGNVFGYKTFIIIGLFYPPRFL